jgi:hypothetical protein
MDVHCTCAMDLNGSDRQRALIYFNFKYVGMVTYISYLYKIALLNCTLLMELLTPKVLGVFFMKTASKQPLFKARWILQTWGLF